MAKKRSCGICGKKIIQNKKGRYCEECMESSLMCESEDFEICSNTGGRGNGDTISKKVEDYVVKEIKKGYRTEAWEIANLVHINIKSVYEIAKRHGLRNKLQSEMTDAEFLDRLTEKMDFDKISGNQLFMGPNWKIPKHKQSKAMQKELENASRDLE